MRSISLIGLAVLLPLMTGCGKQQGAADVRAQAVPVSGKVLYANGQPVANAWVIFHPKDKPGIESTAATDDAGVFKLNCYDKEDGAIPGRYTVTVEPHPKAKGPKQAIPGKFSSTESSPLKVEVKNEGSNDLPPFRLQ